MSENNNPEEKLSSLFPAHLYGSKVENTVDGDDKD